MENVAQRYHCFVRIASLIAPKSLKISADGREISAVRRFRLVWPVASNKRWKLAEIGHEIHQNISISATENGDLPSIFTEVMEMMN